jgi:hypothetical protein
MLLPPLWPQTQGNISVWHACPWGKASSANGSRNSYSQSAKEQKSQRLVRATKPHYRSNDGPWQMVLLMGSQAMLHNGRRQLPR